VAKQKEPTAVAFDTLQYTRRLQAAGFSVEQADALTEATRDLLAEEMVTRGYLTSELDKLAMRLTIRMGTLVGLGVGVLAAIIKL